jgi:GrpB-like predicted nucleotidyltransferase (UPF0157 family)
LKKILFYSPVNRITFGGLLDKVIVVPYDPDWQSEFETESKHILHALGDNAASIHHIGSTAIPKMSAKPIIDILLEVYDLDRLDRQTSAIEELAYDAMGEYGIPRRRYFRKGNRLGMRTHHLHAFQVGSPEIERHLAFRDYMITHLVEAEAYSALKQDLAQAHPNDRKAYMDGKDKFVKEHETKALEWRSSYKGMK